MSTKKIAYCGDCCNHCPRYKATLSGNKQEIKDVAILWKKIGWPYDLDNPEKMNCQGCQDIEKCEYGIKECCIQKNIQNCGKCVDYPCSVVEQAFKITEGYVEDFKNILSNEEYEIFRKAFFMKKENLEKQRI